MCEFELSSPSASSVSVIVSVSLSVSAIVSVGVSASSRTVNSARFFNVSSVSACAECCACVLCVRRRSVSASSSVNAVPCSSVSTTTSVSGCE